MIKKWLKVCSALLVIAMLVNMLPMQAFATETTALQEQELTIEKDTAETTDGEIIEEIVEKRTEYTKDFRMQNGRFLSAVYSEPVHYEKDGQWEEIDNTLKSRTDGTYSNTAGVWDVRFPTQLSKDNRISITKDTYTLSFAMAGELLRKGNLETAGVEESLSSASTDKASSEGIAVETFAISQAQTSTAQVQQPDPERIRTGAEYEEAALEKLGAGLLYADVYGTTDIRYDLHSNQIKESVILESYRSNLRGYRYTLEVGDLHPVLQDNGQIYFYDSQEKNIILVMEAPFLIDSAQACSYDVQVQLTGSGSTYTLTYLLPSQWLSDSQRQWPVILDPVVSAVATVTNVMDQTVASRYNFSYTSPYNYCGYDENYGVLRTYLKFCVLPMLSQSETIVDATVQMYRPFSASNLAVQVHKVSSTWDSATINWSNMPVYDATVEDYVLAGAAGYYSWNVTDIVRGWYTGENTGMMFRTDDATESSSNTLNRQFYSSDYSAYQRPTLYVQYRHNSGIEPYYTYQTMGAGQAGSAYVADATGQLKVVKCVASYASVANPFQMNLVYNSDYFMQNGSATDTITTVHGIDMWFGEGFKMDVVQSLKEADIENAVGKYLVWHDGDGTDHYFQKQSNGSYKDEDGLGLTITKSGSNYTMSDDQGNNWLFTDGLLSQISDEDGNKTIINWEGPAGYRYFYTITQRNAAATYDITLASITYIPGTSYIHSLTDAAGRVFTFTYSDDASNKKLTGIAMNGTELADYTYSENRLTSMKDLESGYELLFGYAGGKVSYVQEFTAGSEGPEPGAQMEVNYGNELTTYRDYGNDHVRETEDDILTHYSFDYWGRTVNAYSTDNDKKILGATNTVYSGSGDTGTKLRQNNRALQTGSIGSPAMNMLKNPSFESGTDYWLFSGADGTATLQTSTYTRKTGAYSLEGNAHGGTLAAYTAAVLTAGKTYTFSCYVETAYVTSFGNGIRLIVSNASNAWHGNYLTEATTSVDSNWTRISLTLTPTETATYSCMIQAVGVTGYFYADDFQIEEGEVPSTYNMVENGDLETYQYGWLFQGSSYYSDANNARVLALTGSPTVNTCAWQNVMVHASGAETYVLSGWAKGNSVPDNDNATINVNYASDEIKRFGLQAIVIYADASLTREYHYVPFCPDINDWQFASLTVVPKQPDKQVYMIQVVCAYEQNANAAVFDKISLIKEPAQTMRYDDEGNLVSVTTSGMEKETATYQNGNLMSAYTGGSGTYTYEYDSTYKHRVTAVSDDAIKQHYTYDSFGNVTSTVLTQKYGSEINLTTTAVYEGFGDRLGYTADANGAPAWYYYGTELSKMNAAPTKVSTALPGTSVADTATKWLDTETAYDQYGRTTSVTVKEKLNYETVANLAAIDYTYNNGNLTNILRTVTGASQGYTFSYDTWGNMTSVTVGETTLAAYHYGAGNGLLQRMNYGNGFATEYSYDALGRTKTVVSRDASGNAVRTLTYTYNSEGQLYRVYDSANQTAYTYVYDTLGRLVEAQQGSIRTSNAFNSYNQLIRQRYSSPLSSDTVTYTYDTEQNNGRSNGILAGMQMVNGDTTVYTYDGLQRMTYKHLNSGKDGGGMWERFDYDGTRIFRKINWKNDTDVVSQIFYTYDASGNIVTEINELLPETSARTVTYTYDALNQLTGVSGAGRNETYSYDAFGNLQSFNNGNGISHSYTYGDSQWRDLLTAVDGNAITYDAIGNPTQYYNGSTFTWTEGRRLQSVTSNGSTTSYEYDANGLRTKKINPDGTYIIYYIADGLYLGETRHSTDGSITQYIRYVYDESSSVVGISLKSAEDAPWTEYYFAKNLQGDVMAVYQESNGDEVASYTYDAWGNIISKSGNLADLNLFRYRGYYYDTETGFYYVSSRYYDPEIGRWINADGYVSTGQGVLGSNMFAYCGNNPIVRLDLAGTRYCAATSISKERSYERRYACYWQKQVTLEKYNPKPIGSYSKGNVYLVENEDDVYSNFPGDIVVLDQRGPEKNDGVEIRYSFLVSDKNHQREILTLLYEFEEDTPTGWIRTVDSMMIEWDAHNDSYSILSFTPFTETRNRAAHVFFNNCEEGWSYWDHTVGRVLTGK